MTTRRQTLELTARVNDALRRSCEMLRDMERLRGDVMAIIGEHFECDFCDEDQGVFDEETGNHAVCTELHNTRERIAELEAENLAMAKLIDDYAYHSRSCGAWASNPKCTCNYNARLEEVTNLRWPNRKENKDERKR